MPVEFDEAGGPIKEQIRVVPSDEGLDSQILRVTKEGEDPRSAWEKLDKLPGASRLTGVKLGATVLARSGAEPTDPPLIVRQEYGKGRVLAIAFDTTWRWVLSPKDTSEMQRRFWRQVALYLSAPRGNVWVETDRPNYDLRKLQDGRELIRVTAGVEDSSGVPITTADPQVELVRLGEDEEPAERIDDVPLVVDEQRRQYTGELNVETLRKLQPDRRYAVRITATVEDKDLQAEYEFEVSRPAPDAQDTQADFDTLRRLTLQTRGGFRRLDEFDALLREIRLAARPKKEQQAETLNLADALRWPIIVAVLVFLCLEWAWRKRRGLV
jgi:hypothetical protein